VQWGLSRKSGGAGDRFSRNVYYGISSTCARISAFIDAIASNAVLAVCPCSHGVDFIEFRFGVFPPPPLSASIHPSFF